MEERCIQCILKKNLDRVPPGAEAADVKRYQERVLQLTKEISSRPDGSAPEISSMVDSVRQEIFHWSPLDYSKIKVHYNQLMLDREEQLEETIRSSADPLRMALAYALTGNYIDFAALDHVDEGTLERLMQGARDVSIPEKTLEALREDIQRARRAAYVTDNCGEVVLDKLLIRQMQRENPDLAITVIVRGAPVHNDATIEDARQVGLPEVCRVISNGTWLNGTILSKISAEARETLTGADFILAKGQANCETLEDCGLNIYYAFLCKCEKFVERYGVEPLCPILAREREDRQSQL